MTDPIAIADSSPLIALAAIEQLELLRQLYQRVAIPPAVWNEVVEQGEDLPGAQAVRQLSWLEQESPEPTFVEFLELTLDRGEAEAIALARGIPDSTVLLDDARARRAAEQLGIRRIGTLGILRRAKQAGLLDRVEPSARQLQASKFYISQRLIDRLLREVGEAGDSV